MSNSRSTRGCLAEHCSLLSFSSLSEDGQKYGKKEARGGGGETERENDRIKEREITKDKM
jgi:hypothetical protein